MDTGKREHREETGNLIAAAKWLTKPVKQIDTEAINQQLKDLFGDQAPEMASQQNELEPFPVLEENWPAICLFLQCQTQWNYLSGMTVMRTGLNYQAVETVMRLCYADQDQADLFNRLQVIEREALNAQGEG